MSHLSEIVDSLENRIGKLLDSYNNLKQTNQKLEDEMTSLKSEQHKYESVVTDLQDECNSLRLANSILGSDQHKRETKLKINALIREIDQCITQLSE